MNIFAKAITAAAIAASTTASLAADFPKSGSAKGKGYMTYTSISQHEGWDAEMQPSIYTGDGITIYEGLDVRFHSRCLGQDAMIAGAYVTSGTCTETDTDGDKIFLTYNMEGFTYVGGTGKYKGITGGGTTVSDPIVQGKTTATVESYEKHWEIK